MIAKMQHWGKEVALLEKSVAAMRTNNRAFGRELRASSDPGSTDSVTACVLQFFQDDGGDEPMPIANDAVEAATASEASLAPPVEPVALEPEVKPAVTVAVGKKSGAGRIIEPTPKAKRARKS